MYLYNVHKPFKDDKLENVKVCGENPDLFNANKIIDL